MRNARVGFSSAQRGYLNGKGMEGLGTVGSVCVFSISPKSSDPQESCYTSPFRKEGGEAHVRSGVRLRN